MAVMAHIMELSVQEFIEAVCRAKALPSMTIRRSMKSSRECAELRVELLAKFRIVCAFGSKLRTQFQYEFP